MKERIRQIMESQHMTQQVFAEFLGVAPATISGILTGRTNPTRKVIEDIKKHIPNINTDWLMFGMEPMYNSTPSSAAVASGQPSPSANPPQESLFDFVDAPSATPQDTQPVQSYQNQVRPMRQEPHVEVMKNFDKNTRRVTEIRVFYDDQTWESFVPAKK